jgi:hypothetical protein
MGLLEDSERERKIAETLETALTTLKTQSIALVEVHAVEGMLLAMVYALASTHPNKDLVRTRFHEARALFANPSIEKLREVSTSGYTQQVLGALMRAIGSDL